MMMLPSRSAAFPCTLALTRRQFPCDLRPAGPTVRACPSAHSNAGVPSSAFMLLFKLFTLQITKSQIERLLSHPDSAYIRAIGVLYLRQCCDPKTLFTWRAARPPPSTTDGRSLCAGRGGEVNVGARRGACCC